MLDEVYRHILREGMLDPMEPVIVAVSGGIDSMVLLHALRKLRHPCTVVHVDHGLRGAESDADREFVEAHCKQEGIPFHWGRVEVEPFMREHGISAQMAARELRYGYLEDMTPINGVHKVALAHHADDAVETLLLHLLRGTGTFGWRAMEPITVDYLRPLLCVHRSDVVAYALENEVAYREDSSNASDKYLRNRIRHEVIPLLDRLRPGASRAMARSVRLLRDVASLGNHALEDMVQKHSMGPDMVMRVPFADLESSPYCGIQLYGLLRNRGFHPDVIERVHDAIAERATGAEFIVAGSRVVVDRNDLFITQDHSAPAVVWIEELGSFGKEGSFVWRSHDHGPISIPRTMDEVVLNANALSFPLELRPWRQGDRMHPIGLGGSKLVSDILIDAKVPLHEKDGTYVLVSGEVIAWLVGHRIGEGFQLEQDTDPVLWIQQDRA